VSAPRRREFIPAIREAISNAVPGADQAIQESIDAWRDGLEPSSPWETGVFGVCDKVAADIDAQGDDEDPDRCTNPGGHEWDKTLGEADEARIRGDVANDRITCVHCGADGDS